ncbi:hypothetical protein GV054_09190 [Marinomonas mediterranea]|jgi:hypothetical protein|uniref:Uncharacterized protein n=1 Tax=Marinomonas mediterranea (strain ATCC 700492 / JCM 21426 / NBRC 103028 / MMB-1) TaxID=717774 RepID=F2K230_MARM1|nr:hypothetical protein [Marinomonas mediterranea]ADZ91108.1 hypothetical protein Marme_1852 [Marinomonas mediterranea MMB-1]WCN13169.1 hypothetical protein GV054_09190 [Marinomonas mediterranea]WCN17240.1 hypothetical protein GV053_09350 [Marinomonas mediterranea MMB-1]
MANQSKTQPKQYEVLNPYQCPNKKHWHEKGDTVNLLPCEAEYLILSGKVALARNTAKPKGEA